MISKSNVKFTDSEVRMASRFASSTQQEIEKLLEDKDSENTKRSTKAVKELFYEYLKEKNIQEPHDKRISQSIEIFLCGSAKKGWIVLLYGKPENIEVWTNIHLFGSRQFS